MTLPRARLPRLNSVAVGAANDALVAGDLSFDGGDGLERRDIRCFPLHVVDVERSGVRVVTAVDTPSRDLKVSDPRFHCSRSIVGDTVIPSLCRGVSDPVPVVALSRIGVIGPLWPRTTRTKRRAVLGRISLGEERTVTQHATPLFSGRIFPGRHTLMIPADDRYPCKPGIFAKTYEEVAE